MRTIYYKSEIVDTVINTLEVRMKHEGKHLLKTSTVMKHVRMHINLNDDSPEREELMEIGVKQVIQGRLYAHGYFSISAVKTGYFVNIDQCDNLLYLQGVLDNKDGTIEGKIKARNRLKELKGLNGQMVFVPDNNGLNIIETKTQDELNTEIEADAI